MDSKPPLSAAGLKKGCRGGCLLSLPHLGSEVNSPPRLGRSRVAHRPALGLLLMAASCTAEALGVRFPAASRPFLPGLPGEVFLTFCGEGMDSVCKFPWENKSCPQEDVGHDDSALRAWFSESVPLDGGRLLAARLCAWLPTVVLPNARKDESQTEPRIEERETRP